jgi:hypothetical protein
MPRARDSTIRYELNERALSCCFNDGNNVWTTLAHNDDVPAKSGDSFTPDIEILGRLDGSTTVDSLVLGVRSDTNHYSPSLKMPHLRRIMLLNRHCWNSVNGTIDLELYLSVVIRQPLRTAAGGRGRPKMCLQP